MKIKCLLNGIDSFIKCGCFIPHTFEDTYKKTNIITTENDFRASDSYQHSNEETVHMNCYLITSKCVDCGKEEYSWCTPEMYLRMGNTLK